MTLTFWFSDLKKLDDFSPASPSQSTVCTCRNIMLKVLLLGNFILVVFFSPLLLFFRIAILCMFILVLKTLIKYTVLRIRKNLVKPLHSS